MALNEKAAMVICVVFTAGMPCALHRFAAQVEVPSPLRVGAVRDGLAGLPSAAAWNGSVTADPRANWARQFARPNSLDAQALANQAAKDALALAPPDELLAPQGVVTALPPLVYPELLVADAGELEPGLLPGDEQVLVASADIDEGDDADAAPSARLKRYRVAKGDTLSRIARREWKSDDWRLVALLAEANPGVRERKNRIVVGEELFIPDAAAVQRALGRLETGSESVVAQAPAGDTKSGAATADERWYTIQRKDTLAGIARRFLNDGRRWREIVALNRALDPDKILPGTRIKLPPVIRLAQG
jgi:nucleoid-associated protein YgaU